MRIRSFTASLALLLALSACAATPPPPDAAPTMRHFNDASLQAYADKEFAIDDPAEGTNKEIYKFNAGLDEYVFLPVVNAYTYVTPKIVRTGVSNFFLNIGEVNNFTNALLQLKPKKAGLTLVRFVLNTTVGIAGTMDVATRAGIQRQPEDFGKTLGFWGTGSGPYIVLPFLGPSNLRDTTGKLFDYATLYFLVPEHIQETVPYDVVAYGLQPIDLRYSNSFRYYSSGSPFEYEMVRYINTTLRNAEIDKERKE